MNRFEGLRRFVSLETPTTRRRVLKVIFVAGITAEYTAFCSRKKNDGLNEKGLGASNTGPVLGAAVAGAAYVLLRKKNFG